MLATAHGHKDVLREPPPKVFFKKIGDITLDFELVCVVGEIDSTLRVTSDLHFIIHNGLVDGKIGTPEHEVSIKGLDRIEDTLEDIVDAIGNERDAAAAHLLRKDAPQKDAALNDQARQASVAKIPSPPARKPV